jgi:hypothetical protein
MLARKMLEKEDLAIVRGFGSLAFLRSQGRTLQEDSQSAMLELLRGIRLDLDRISTRDDFEVRHQEWVGRISRELRTNTGGELAYGQGQKTINVFLKFYVDWASRPTGEIADRIRPWLHCPLDKVVMEWLRARDVAEWKRRIWSPYYAPRQVQPQQRSSMSKVDAGAYSAWQQWIRDLLPEKPVCLDLIWSLAPADRPTGT